MIVYHLDALEEMQMAAEKYAAIELNLAEAFLSAVHAALESIERYPKIGRSEGTELRSRVVRGFPYSLVYASSEALIEVVAIAHHKRQPGYWKDRG